MNGELINIKNDDAQYEALKAHQDKYMKNNDTQKDTLSHRPAVDVQHEDGRP